ncbi:MAG: alpha/beta hydrolase [Acutalibacter sp.]|jgi:fermentation-respiration switch protein FrsA (DUF1100 family)
MLWLWILLIVIAVVAVLLGVASWYFFKFSIRRYRRELTDQQYNDDGSIWQPFAQRMAQAQEYIRAHTAERPKITSYDGLELTALYLPAPETPKGTVIAFHGYRSLATIDFALEVEFLNSLGYDLLLPYQRSHGESQGKYITYGVKERYDCRDWAKYAAGRWGNRPLFLMGISMGAATVMMASDLDLPESTRGIVADCGFTSPWEIMAHVAKRDFHLPPFPLLYLLDGIARWRAGFSLKEADSRQALSRTTLPVLFLHGEDDDFVPVSMTREDYQACRGEKYLRLVPGAAHAQSFAVDTQGCQQAIEEFLQRYGQP